MENGARKICGIYALINIVNWHLYIGQAIDCFDREKEHYREARRQKRKGNKEKGCIKLNNAIIKYGESNFRLCILEEVNPFVDNLKSILDKKEIFYISLFNSRKDCIGYNITPGGFGVGSGEDHPSSILTNKDVFDIREMYKEGYQRKEAWERFIKSKDCIKVSYKCFKEVWAGDRNRVTHYDVYDIPKDIIYKRRFERSYGISVDEIRRRRDSGETRSEIYQSIKNSKLSQDSFDNVFYNKTFIEDKRSNNGTKRKRIIRLNPKDPNDVRIYESLVDASKDMNVNTGNISKCCNGKKHIAFGYIWKFIED